MNAGSPKSASFQKKLAGLVAVGAAGGLAHDAHSAIQYFDITDASVGFGNLATLTIDLAGDNDIEINFISSVAASSFQYVIDFAGGGEFAVESSAPKPFDSGESNTATFQAGLNLVWSGSNTTSASSFTGSSFSSKFYMFRFQDTSDSNNTKFGWMGVTLALDTTTKPVLTVHDYAYDDSGATLTAGQTVIPEPTSLSLGAIAAALLLGGRRGVRKYRNRKSQSPA